MTSSRIPILLIAATLMLAACAVGGERARGGPAAPGGYAHVDPALVEALDDAPACCRTLVDLPYQPLPAHGQFAVALTPESPAFEFESGKSFFAAYALAGLTRPFTLEIASRLPEGDEAAGPRPPFAPTALILDAEHRVIQQIDSEPSAAICRPGERGAAYSLRWRSDSAPTAASYLVLLSTEQMRRSSRKLLCGVAHRGLSPVGEMVLGSYDDGYGMGENAAISARAHRPGDAGKRAAEPGILLIGSTAVHYLERAMVGFRHAIEIPFARIDFAKASDGAAWQRAGRRLSIGYRPTASDSLASIDFEPDCSGPKPMLFADQLASEIEARLPAAGAPRR